VISKYRDPVIWPEKNRELSPEELEIGAIIYQPEPDYRVDTLAECKLSDGLDLQSQSVVSGIGHGRAEDVARGTKGRRNGKDASVNRGDA
jgi:hypothetical protein